MKDVKNFCKLFDLSVPSYDEFDYYRSMYKRIGRHSDIDNLITMYEEVENSVGDMLKYRVDNSERLVNYIKSTRAFTDLNLDPMIPDLPVNKSFTYEEGKYYVSFDLIKANWQAVKKYDPDFINEMSDSWESLVSGMDMHPIVSRSKQLRQYVFGNLNPKKLMKVQRHIVEDLVLSLSGVVCIRYDEVVLVRETFEAAKLLVDSVSDDRFRASIFMVNQYDGFRINSYFDNSGVVVDREPVGCNGHKYFMTLKTHIFDEALDVRDLYFRMDGELAMWVLPEIDVKI
jgi:hypothetical protein